MRGSQVPTYEARCFQMSLYPQRCIGWKRQKGCQGLLLTNLSEKPQSHLIPAQTQDDELEISRRGHQSRPVTSISHALPTRVYDTHTYMCIHAHIHTQIIL